jgi:hypothetical protein
VLETAGKSTFARKHLDAHRAATMTVRVTPNARGRRAIAQNRRAHRATFVNISVTYTPNGGTASTQTKLHVRLVP